MSNPLDTVLAIYSAFGTGDVPTILSYLDTDVSWDEGIRTTNVPYLQPGRGIEHVTSFFGALNDNLEITQFEFDTPAVGGDGVLVRVRISGRNRSTGREIPVAPEVHHWVVDDSGKVTAFSHIGDWAIHEAAAA